MQLADNVGEDKGEEGDDEGGAEDVDCTLEGAMGRYGFK